RQLVGLALDEAVKGEQRVQAAADNRAFPGLGRYRRFRLRSRRPAGAADIDDDPGRLATSHSPERRVDGIQEAFLDPFQDETVGREQSQQAGRFLRLKGTDPGVE